MSKVYKKKDLVGNRYGMLTVIEDYGKRSGSSILWRCKCDCGGGILAVRHELVSGKLTDCGCISGQPRPQVTDLIGRRFGMLTVIEDSGQRSGSGVILWKCCCDCGGTIQATRQQLVSGNTANCGCIPKQHAPKNQAEDLTGRQFGELTVIRRAENNKSGRVCWICRCSCGKECTVQALKLKSGHTRSCGCRRYQGSGNKLDLAGQRFGRLTALYYVSREDRVKTSYWHCRCDCGNELDVNTMSLLRGATQSCGCWNAEQSGKVNQYLHRQDNTCIERLQRIHSDRRPNKSGFRGLFLTDSGKYRATITFQGVHYHLGHFSNMADAIKARLDAEAVMHDGYVAAYDRYLERAEKDPEWAKQNPFYYTVQRGEGGFIVSTNAETA